MSEQPVQAPPWDPGNPGVQMSIPATLWTVSPPGAPQILLMTVRSGGTTLTVHLTRDDAITWGRQLVKAGQAMSGIIVPNAVIPPNGLKP